LIDGGADPVGEHRSVRGAPTVNGLCDRFEAEYLPRKRASTQRTYRNQIKSAIRPKLGKLKVASVSFSDIDALHRGLSETPYRANRIIALVSKMFAMAIKWEMRTDNPVKGIERNGEDKRKRYLKGDELARLTVALAEHRDQQAANIVRLLLLTGARKGELLAATWDQFNLEAGVWTKPGATTKQKTEHEIPLSAPARQLLTGLHKARDRSGYLFPGRLGHRREIKDSWTSICRAAGIEGLRIHDLRHSYASALAGAGFSLPIIGALLGHTQPSTTSRYAHLQDDPLRVATERAGAILSGQPSAEIVLLPDRRRGR
jgi:integrase